MVLNQLFSKFALIGENLELKENVHLEINNNGIIKKISFNSPEKSSCQLEEKEILLILPGFINSHVHVGDNFAKEQGLNKKLNDIVAPPYGLKHILLENTPPKIQIEGIRNAILEMYSHGITTFMDFRERGLEGIKILKVALENFKINSYIYGRFENIDEIDKIFENADGIGLVSYNQISTAIKNKLKLAKAHYNKLISCHIAELKRDEDSMKRLIEDDIVDILVHGTHFQKEDLALIVKNKKCLVLCPRSNGYFGVGFPPIADILDLKIPISLGTDNLMANNTDLFEEMRFLYRISRVLAKSNELSSKELLKMVTINAARNFNIEHKLGSISEGKNADFFIIDLNSPNYYSYKLEKEVIYHLIVQRTKSENIKKVYIKGELVFDRT